MGVEMSELNDCGKVVKIMSDRQLVINIGENKGASVGDYVGVIDPDKEKVSDPSEGTAVGEIVYFKASLRLTHVSAHLSVASTYRTRTVNKGGVMGVSVSKMLDSPKWEKEVENFPVAGVERREGAELSVGDDVIVVAKEIADVGFLLEDI